MLSIPIKWSRYLQNFVAMISLSLISFSSFGLPSITLEQGIGYYPLGLSSEIFEDREAQYSIHDFLSQPGSGSFEPSTVPVPNFGMTTSVIWVRFQLTNNLDKEKEWILNIPYPPLENVRLYVVDEDNTFTQKQTGDGLPFRTRDIKHEDINFIIHTEPGSKQTYYIRFESGGTLQLPMIIWDPMRYIEESNKKSMGLGIYYGIILVIVLYNLFLFASVREPSYLFYVLYVSSLGLFQLSLNGVTFIYISGDSPEFNPWYRTLGFAGTIFFTFLFAQSFLRTEKFSPRLHRFLILLASLTAANTVLSIFLTYKLAITIFIFLSLIAIPTVLLAGVQSWAAGYSPARFYTIAWVAFLFGGLLMALRNVGWVPNTMLTTHGMKIGSAIEVILLSLALGSRIAYEKKAKYLAEKQAIENLKRSEKMKDSFMATMSHELRTPMNGIIGSLELVENANKTSADIVPFLHTAERSAQHMKSLIEDILCFADAQNERILVNKSLFNIKESLSPTIEHFTSLCHTKGLDFNFEIDPDLANLYEGDRKKMEKIVFHLVDNAVKFTHLGKVSLKISTAFDGAPEPGYSAISFEVSDTGIGISKEKIQAVFDAFQQADSSFTRNYCGLGIGLAICKSLVNALQGTISFSSSDRGTTFNVVLFFRHYDDAANEPRPVIPFETASTPLSILIVEDNPVNQMVIGKLVAQLGHSVLNANNGQQAIDILKTNAIDLIFMDCQMPILDGYQATQIIRQTHIDIPIVAVTANAQDKDRQRCFEVGMNDFVSKPIRKGIIAEKIACWARINAGNNNNLNNTNSSNNNSSNNNPIERSGS